LLDRQLLLSVGLSPVPETLTATAGLWLAVVGSGVYHGVNPGMGWPLAVSAALMERRRGALLSALGALAAGHFLAMVAVLLPFAAMTSLVAWEREIRAGAALVVIGFGVWLLIYQRHPRFLARIPPSRLALWSFLVAIAHGAGLMLVPIFLGLGTTGGHHAGHLPESAMMMHGAGLSVTVAAAHTAAMILSGGAIAVAVYAWLGLKFLNKGWFDLDRVWALSLVVVGGIGLWTSVR
jgi:hypothetical protein